MKRIVTLVLLLFSAQVYAQVVLYENFESTVVGHLPTGWTSNNPNWKCTDEETEFSGGRFSSDPAGTHYIVINDNVSNANNVNAILKTPSLNLTGLSKPVLCFEYFFDSTQDESFEILVSTDGGGNWNTIDKPAKNPSFVPNKAWKHYRVDLAAYSGLQDVIIGFKYSDGGQHRRGVGLDVIKILDEKTNDAAVDYINMSRYIANGSNVIFYCRNLGTSTINTLTAEYWIGNGVKTQQTITKLNIPPGVAQNISFAKTINGITTPAIGEQLFVTVLQVNGAKDNNNNDNTASTSFIGASKLADRNGLIEEFGNRACGPCLSFNNSFDPVILNNHVNSTFAKMNVIKYLIDFPDTDPSCNDDALTRRYYYDVNGIPKHFNNGAIGQAGQNCSQADIQAEIDECKATTAALDIEGSYSVQGNTASGTVKLIPYFTCNGNYRVLLAVTERYYYDSSSYGSQKHFYHTMRKMFPDGEGYTISSFTDNIPVTYSFNYTFSVGNVQFGGYNFWGDVAESDLIVFVQDVKTHEVLQSLSIPANTHMHTGVRDIVLQDFSVYPNPVQSSVTISAAETITRVEVMSLVGQKMFAANTDTNKFVVDMQSYPKGMYFIRINGKHISRVVKE